MDTTSATSQKNISGERIRAATVSDIRGIAEVHVQSWQTSYRGLVPDDALDDLSVDVCAAEWANRFRELSPPRFCFVSLDENGRINGFIHAGPARQNDLGPGAEVYAIYLAAEAKRKGIGRALMCHAVSSLRDAGFRSLCLWFLKDNPARAFYERFGGKVVAEKPYARPGFVLPSLGCVWEDLDALIHSLTL